MAPLPPPTSTRRPAPERSQAARIASTWAEARRAIDALNTASSWGWAANHSQRVTPFCSS